jgi:hypothetical protein
MFGTVRVVRPGAEDVAELADEPCCSAGWVCLDRVGEAAFGEVPVAFADDPSGCTEAATEAAGCDDPPLHAAVGNTRTASHIRRRRFLCRNRSFMSGRANRRESSAFNSPPSPPGDNNYLPPG